MATPIEPKNGYAFKHKETGAAYLMLFLGSWDSLDNYEEISEEEYQKILDEQSENEERLI
jgi:hypothetical protein